MRSVEEVVEEPIPHTLSIGLILIGGVVFSSQGLGMKK